MFVNLLSKIHETRHILSQASSSVQRDVLMRAHSWNQSGQHFYQTVIFIWTEREFKEKLEERRLKTELWRWEGREAGNTWTTVWCQTDLQLHADRDLLWMFPFPSDKEETSEENANMESQPGGALSLAAEETTHNTLPHICREERLWLYMLGRDELWL